MRSILTGALALGLITLVASPAFGGAIEVNFDENGNGTWVDTTAGGSPFYGNASSGTLSFTLAADPTGSVAGNVLIYLLPELVISGPVDVGEAGDTIGSADPNPSDVLFFTDSVGVNDHGVDANLMIFYSEAGGGELADSGLPSFAGTLLDVANENADGSFTWLPDSQTFPNGNQYNGLSDPTPEPASLSMILLGLGSLGVGAFRRRRAQ